MTTEKVACRCGFLSPPGPFCVACGSPLKQREAAAESAALRPAREPPPEPLPTIAVHVEAPGKTPEAAPVEGGVMCTWCGAISPPGPGCATCGSPIDTGNLVPEEETRFDESSPARLRLVTPPSKEEPGPEKQRDVGT